MQSTCDNIYSRNVVCFRYTIVNTLHNDGDDDNDDDDDDGDDYNNTNTVWLFQGDSLSPLSFCICLIPLTEQMNKLNTGYEEYTTKTKISHLL
jgi:hypothetical protein